MNRVEVAVQRLAHGAELPLPSYMTAGAAGFDLPAGLAEPVTIAPGAIVKLPTGFKLAIPAGYEGQVRPRSGLAIKHGLTLINSPGTIDSDYRGEIMVAMINLGPAPVVINRGDRIAQMIIAPVLQAELREVAELPPSQRGEGGFGHTG
ncbi:MAG: dUTP diphosphatase [Pseudomonadota bacterium]